MLTVAAPVGSLQTLSLLGQGFDPIPHQENLETDWFCPSERVC
jgi:hypothetical protein